MTAHDEKERKKVDDYIYKAIAPYPLSATAQPKPRSSWTPKPWVPGQQGKLSNDG